MKDAETIRRSLLAAAVIVVFLGSLVLAVNNGLYISPDETANAFFATHFSQTGSLLYFDPLNFELSNFLVPRSMVSVDGFLAPGSFIGLPILYGAIAMLFGAGILPFLTPVIAAIAVFLWYGLVKRLANERIAFWAALLLAIHPGWWYYSARSLMHNVLFTSLLIASAYVLLAHPLKKTFVWANPLLSGLLFGAALFARTSEIIWLGFAALLILILARAHVTWKSALLFAGGAAIAIFPLLPFNMMTYGSPYITGYTIQNGVELVAVDEPAPPSAIDPRAPEIWHQFQDAIRPIFPFGIHPRNILRHVGWYGIGLFWWMSLLAIIGIAPFFFEKHKERHKRCVYFWTSVFVGLWLAIMYGSWVIHDNPDPSQVTIGNSYIRYWLPAFVLSTPFAAYGINWIVERARTVFAKRLAVGVLLLASFGLSLHAVYAASDDNLLSIRETLNRSKAIQAEVLSLTEEDSIIIVDRADKLFFPYRSVRQPLRAESTYAGMPFMLNEAPLYYYGVTFPEQDMQFLNGEKLAELGLRIDLVKTFDAESLYEITRR